MERLFWVDMEMTGLDIEEEVIIEVASIVTDLNFVEIDSLDCVVYQPQKILEEMDDWNKEHHGKSGLIQKIPNGLPIEIVETKLINFVKKHFPDPNDRPILAGNSITQDRQFINKYMPSFGSYLHYRMLDVSSWKIIMNNKYKVLYRKSNQHRALDDIRESIQELAYYCQFLEIPPNGNA